MTRRNRRGDAHYFDEPAGAPPPLAATCSRRVRFEETDPLGIVWHGRYPSYFEDGRCAFGERYGLGYLDMRGAGFIAPIVAMHVDYYQPLRFGEECAITARLHWSDAARLNFSYSVRTPDEQVAAAGCTIQMLTDPEGEVLFVWPEFMEAFREKWRSARWA